MLVSYKITRGIILVVGRVTHGFLGSLKSSWGYLHTFWSNGFGAQALSRKRPIDFIIFFADVM